MSNQRLRNVGIDFGQKHAALSPQLARTLELLLEGGSEKEMADPLGVSKHTVHAYVKALYRHFDVSSRPELTAMVLRTLLTSLRLEDWLQPLKINTGPANVARDEYRDVAREVTQASD